MRSKTLALSDLCRWTMREEILTELIEKTSLLTPEEQLRLIVALAEKVRATAMRESKSRWKWSDLPGMLPYPACGVDAQTFISRSRRESDETRRLD
jgi:hypothetical protein